MANRIAIIENGVVVNIILADPGWLADNGLNGIVIPDDLTVSIGWLWNGDSFAQPAPDPASPVMSRLAFMRRFTMQERIAIRAAVPTDPVLADVNALLELAQEVSLDDPDTQMAIGYMTQLGILTAERAAEILNL